MHPEGDASFVVGGGRGRGCIVSEGGRGRGEDLVKGDEESVK